MEVLRLRRDGRREEELVGIGIVVVVWIGVGWRGEVIFLLGIVLGIVARPRGHFVVGMSMSMTMSMKDGFGRCG